MTFRTNCVVFFITHVGVNYKCDIDVGVNVKKFISTSAGEPPPLQLTGTKVNGATWPQQVVRDVLVADARRLALLQQIERHLFFTSLQNGISVQQTQYQR